MKAKKYQTKLDASMAEGIYEIIDTLLHTTVTTDDDKLVFCALAEIHEKLASKIHKKEGTISFTPAQAFALRILSIDYVSNTTSYTGNKLHQISNEVHHFYQ